MRPAGRSGGRDRRAPPGSRDPAAPGHQEPDPRAGRTRSRDRAWWPREPSRPECGDKSARPGPPPTSPAPDEPAPPHQAPHRLRPRPGPAPPELGTAPHRPPSRPGPAHPPGPSPPGPSPPTPRSRLWGRVGARPGVPAPSAPGGLRDCLSSSSAPPPSCRSGRYGDFSEGETEACPWSRAWVIMELACPWSRGSPPPWPQSPWHVWASRGLSHSFSCGRWVCQARGAHSPQFTEEVTEAGSGAWCPDGPARGVHTKESALLSLSPQATWSMRPLGSMGTRSVPQCPTLSFCDKVTEQKHLLRDPQ